jgi:DNA polymerase-3 subunit beta
MTNQLTETTSTPEIGSTPVLSAPLSISILQENLLLALAALKPAVGNGKYIPILANVFVDANEDKITLWATDLQTYIRVRVASRVHQAGQATLNYKAFYDLVKSCPPERIDIDDRPANKGAMVSCGERNQNKIATLPAADFPVWPNESEPSCVVEGELFGQAVAKTATNAIKASVTARAILLAINVRLNGNTLSLTASDGDRIAVRSVAAAGGVDHVIETNIDARELKAVAAKLTGNVLLSITSKGLVISAAHSDIFVRAIDGKYPDVGEYLDNAPTTTVQLAAPLLLSAVKRANVFARDVKEHATTLAVDDEGYYPTGLFSLSAASQETGDSFERLAAVVTGKNVAAKINARAAIDLLTAIGKQDVIVQFGANGKTVLFRPADDIGVAYVLAAIRDVETRPEPVKSEANPA